MTRTIWDRMLMALVWIKLGQDLGSNTPVSRAVHDLVAVVLAFACK